MIKLLGEHQVAYLLDEGFLAHAVRHLSNYNVVTTILALLNISNGTNRN